MSDGNSSGGFINNVPLLGFASNLITNLFNRNSNNKTNQTNLKIAQMNNEWSERMMQKQMDYNTDMWNKTNLYNDPSNQRARLEKAGLNPSLMMNGGSAGIASAASGPSLPSPSQAVMQPNRYQFYDIGQAVQNAYVAEGQRKQMDSVSRVNNATADWYGAKAMADLAESFLRSGNLRLQNKGLEIQNKWADSMLGAQYINQIRQNQSMEVSILNSIKQGFLLDKDLAYYDARANGELSEQMSRISLNLANGTLSLQQAKKAMSETLTDIEKRVGMKMDNYIKAQSTTALIQRAKDAQNLYQLGQDAFRGMNRFGSDIESWFDKNIMKPTKRYWKDTKRSFGLK